MAEEIRIDIIMLMVFLLIGLMLFMFSFPKDEIESVIGIGIIVFSVALIGQ